MLHVSVIDHGIGIAEDKLAMLFEPFIQADPSTTRRFGGSGLGLSICRRLVRLMNGDITVSSTLGEGSTFSFWCRFQCCPPTGRRRSPHSNPFLHSFGCWWRRTTRSTKRSSAASSHHLSQWCPL